LWVSSQTSLGLKGEVCRALEGDVNGGGVGGITEESQEKAAVVSDGGLGGEWEELGALASFNQSSSWGARDIPNLDSSLVEVVESSQGEGGPVEWSTENARGVREVSASEVEDVDSARTEVVRGDGDRVGHQVVGSSVESSEGLVPWDLDKLPGEWGGSRIGERELDSDFGDEVSFETNNLAVGVKEFEGSEGEVSSNFEVAGSDDTTKGTTGVSLQGGERKKA